MEELVEKRDTLMFMQEKTFITKSQFSSKDSIFCII